MEGRGDLSAGRAREVWLTQGRLLREDKALGRLGIDRPTEPVYSRQVLERLGVPGDAIHLLPERNVNAADEVRTIAREPEAADGVRAIIVTSKFNSRRVKVLWHALVSNRPEAVVRYSPDDLSHAERRLHATEDAAAISHEWFGLLNAWARFPVKSAR